MSHDPENPNATVAASAGRSLLQRLNDALFGYDFFISYAHKDGRKYAVSLAQQLRSFGFEVFLDSDDYLPGDDWKRIGAWALKRTNLLVLVGTPAALESKPVLRELEIYTSAGKRVIPIDVAGCIGALDRQHPVALRLETSVLRLSETETQRETGPTENVVNEVHRAFHGDRQQARRLSWIQRTALVLLALVVVALVTAGWAKANRSTRWRTAR